MNLDRLVKDITRKLEAKTNAERKEKAKSYYPTKMRIIGVTVPDLRKVLGEYKPTIKELSEKDKIKLMKKLYDTNIFECQQFALEIINRNKKLVQALTKKDAYYFMKNMDNWVSVDCYSVMIYGPLWISGKISDKDVLAMTKSSNLWKRRITLVSTVALNMASRGGKGDVKRTLMVCEPAADDHEDMIEKALSWALRQLISVDKRAVTQFLKKHDKVLGNRIKREVGNKLKTGLKNKKL